jgi:hypothetical protein
VFSTFLENRMMDKSRNLVILTVIHYHKNPLESAFLVTHIIVIIIIIFNKMEEHYLPVEIYNKSGETTNDNWWECRKRHAEWKQLLGKQGLEEEFCLMQYSTA